MKEKEAHKEFVRVIEEYRQLLVDEKKQLGMVNDVSLLPTDKNTLKVYLLAALNLSKKTNEIEFYKVAYILLAEFQPNVGKDSPYSLSNFKPLKRKMNDFQKSKSNETKDYKLQEINNMTREDMSMYMQYHEIVNKERKKLREELEKLDI